MLRTAKLIKSPSIHNIIIQEHEAKLNNEIKEYFKPETYPSFPLNDLTSLPNYTSDQRFYLLARELQDWNKKVEKGPISKDSRAELYRNKFIFTSLKNIVLNGSRGSVNYENSINKLFEWWRKNSKEQIPLFFTARKKTKQDEDWQVRKTFKSNMPLELKNYERRALFTTQQELNYLHTGKKQQPTEEKLVDYSAIKEFNSKQLRCRQARQEQEIQHCKTLLKSKKSRFDENHCHHFQLYKGNFNSLSKTTAFFGLKTDKSSLIKEKQKLKNSCSFSLLTRQKEQLEKIKKYRFNSALLRKGALFQQKDSNNANFNRTAKTFVSTSKPFDSTISDLGQTLMTTRNEPSLMLNKQISIQVQSNGNKDGNKGMNNQNMEKDLISNVKNGLEEYSQFMELKNWEGQRLMSNPFEKKKQLKKKKNK